MARRRPPMPRRPMAVASIALLSALILASGCSSNHAATTPSTSTSTSVSHLSTTTTVPGTGETVALGTNNPAQGDCTTNTSEAATSVGSLALTLTPSSFQAEIHLQSGLPNTTYGVFMLKWTGWTRSDRLRALRATGWAQVPSDTSSELGECVPSLRFRALQRRLAEQIGPVPCVRFRA
jgi:hypothetical protein